MKKFMMFAAAALLMAGMMVSCNPNGADSKTISGVIKKDIKSVPELVMGKSDADAKKALLDAGFVENEREVMAPARAMKKAPRKVATRAEEVLYVRTVADGFNEYVACGSADGAVFGVTMMWVKDSVVENNTFVDAAQQALLAAYDKKNYPNFVGVLETEEVEKEYIEGKHANFIQTELDQLEAALKAGQITEKEYKEIKEELSIYDLGGCASLVAALKTVKYKEYLYAMGQFADDKAFDILYEDGKGQEGLYKMVMAEMDAEDGFCGIQFIIQKDHLDQF